MIQYFPNYSGDYDKAESEALIKQRNKAKLREINAIINKDEKAAKLEQKKIDGYERRILEALAPKQLTGNDNADFHMTVSFQNAINAVEEHVARDINQISAYEFLSKIQMLEKRARDIRAAQLKRK